MKYLKYLASWTWTLICGLSLVLTFILCLPLMGLNEIFQYVKNRLEVRSRLKETSCQKCLAGINEALEFGDMEEAAEYQCPQHDGDDL